MKKVEKYQTIDGECFNDYVKALEHENTVLLKMLNGSKSSDEKVLREAYLKVLDLPNSPGIYLLTNIRKDKSYVGSAKAIRSRLYGFILGNRHSNEELYRDRVNSEIIDWEISVLENIDVNDICSLEDREEYFIEKLNTYYPNGYNRAKPCRKEKDAKAVRNSRYGVKKFYSKYENLKWSASRMGYELGFGVEEFSRLCEKELTIPKASTNFTLGKIHSDTLDRTITIDEICFLPRRFGDSMLLYKNSVVNSVKKVNDGREEYYFTYHIKGDEITESGFETFNDALIAYATSRIGEICKIADEFKDSVDEKTYDRLKSIDTKKYIKVLFGIEV